MTQFRIGCSGFYNRHWKGIFYPDKLPQRLWFDHYAENFNTLELNVTFYKFPSEAMLNVWYQKSPTDFMFSVKAPRLITHLKKFNDCKSLIDDFYLACSNGLQEKLGYLLFQLPPSIVYSEEKFMQILSLVNTNFRHVIEFRNETWWRQDVYDALAQKGITFCSVSHPKMPDLIIANTDNIYVRNHGVPDMFYSDYSPEKLQALKNEIELKNVSKAYVYFNNTAGIHGILNAGHFRDLTNLI
ncbi:MAG: DUF72 domain-containing protein [Bacteroidia bacterium]|nr:DUF72 domain-containing protein [Bacteroidia bacterium]